MCGIIGYVGAPGRVIEDLIEGLEGVEYRGYDSAGIVVLHPKTKRSILVKVKGKVKALVEAIKTKISAAIRKSVTIGIGHTRWATHGKPSTRNAHPVRGCDNVYVVHNGIIENFRELKTALLKAGHRLKSETDTEVICHLIEDELAKKKDLLEAVRNAIKRLIGTYAIVVLHPDFPDLLVAAKNGSPLVIGIGKDGFFVASDQASFAGKAKRQVILQDGDVVSLTAKDYRIVSPDNHKVKRQIAPVDTNLTKIRKGDYDHFMQKEIHEQPNVLKDAMSGRIVINEHEAYVQLGGLIKHLKKLKRIRRIIIVACGTSFHAGLVAKNILRRLVNIPVSVEYASEFRYDPPVIESGTLVIAISQSGETADTLAALQEAHRLNAPVMGVTNVVGSTIARETDFGVYLRVGPEIGVASTKAFTGQLVVLTMFAVHLARLKGTISEEEAREILSELIQIPDIVREALAPERCKGVRRLARWFKNAANSLYLGRGIIYPVALEGALKLKEISYIHAEGLPAAEMKHGPIALIDPDMPTVIIALDNDALYQKVLSNLSEVKARKGTVIVIANDGDANIEKYAKHIIRIPRIKNSMLTPLVSVIPLQLLAYYVAVLRGCSVDQPRHLAKSVTVE